MDYFLILNVLLLTNSFVGLIFAKSNHQHFTSTLLEINEAIDKGEMPSEIFRKALLVSAQALVIVVARFYFLLFAIVKYDPLMLPSIAMYTYAIVVLTRQSRVNIEFSPKQVVSTLMSIVYFTYMILANLNFF